MDKDVITTTKTQEDKIQNCNDTSIDTEDVQLIIENDQKVM